MSDAHSEQETPGMTGAHVTELRVGVPAPLGPQGAPSSIYRQPVEGRLRVLPLGSEGDRVGDPVHHGGADKAIHAYSLAHYPVWRRELPETAAHFSGGAFGENLVVDGLTESDLCIGDVFTLGSARLQVSQARQPCWKLNIRFERRDMSRQVQDSGRTGWYFRVLEPGEIGAGDAFTLIARPNPAWPLDRVWRFLYRERPERSAIEEFRALEGLSASWRALAEKRLKTRTLESWSRRLDG